ncbi:hypothetical protein [Marinicella sp. W31]|uniref:hypothetical protein n=1 Tax=Marinicella sp. W31 TaxID=3023713 RepID=UPI0037564F55
MKKLLVILVLITFTAFSFAGFLGSKSVPANTNSPQKDLDSVNGSVKVGDNSHVDNLSTVNGSIKVGDNSIVGDVETVNGSIRFGSKVVAQSAETVNGSVNLGSGCQIKGDAETVNGAVVAGSGCVIDGKLETVNGTIQADNTQIEENVETVNGKIKLTDGTYVGGDIIVYKPNGFWNGKKKRTEVYLGKNVKVDGDLIFERPVKLIVHDTAEYSDIEGDDVDIVKL